jgi:hypothetical protein
MCYNKNYFKIFCILFSKFYILNESFKISHSRLYICTDFAIQSLSPYLFDKSSKLNDGWRAFKTHALKISTK